MSNAIDPRLVLLQELSREAESRGQNGLIWSTGRTFDGQPGVIVTAAGKDHAVHIDVVWQGPLGSVCFAPFAGTLPFFRLMLVRIDRRNICFPNEIRCLSYNSEHVLDVLLEWRDQTETVSPKNGDPIGDVEMLRLRNLAASRNIARQDPSCVTIDRRVRELGEWPVGDEIEICRRVAMEFPREADGRLPLGAALLLAPVEETGNELLRKPWIAAIGPAKRRDPQIITVGIEPLIPANHPYRLDAKTGIWNPSAPQLTRADRWGVNGLDLTGLGLTTRDANLVRLAKVCSGEDGTLADRVALCILLQDAGRFGEAFDLFGVSASNDVWRVASGGLLHAGLEKEQIAWAAAVQEALRKCAPWMLCALVAKVKGKKAPRHRLFPLPHQTQVSKTSLMLIADDKGKPKFEFEGNGSSMRLSEERWLRPVEIDLIRFGFEPTDIGD